MSVKEKVRAKTAEPPVDASPTKAFFVDMFVRDIELVDAILDLLDNCVDGILRIAKGELKGDYPYDSYWAHIHFDGKSFRIHDNCGGIPKNTAIEYAFRMGNPDTSRDKKIATVGVYGIGMKRAFFKMGKSIQVKTQHSKDSYQVSIAPRWLASDKEWRLPLSETEKHFEEDGTEIIVRELREEISKEFGSVGSSFKENLERAISQYYSLIIQKGFEVVINGKAVKAKPLELLLDSAKGKKPKIAPYLYHGLRDGVKIDLAVGLYRAPQGMDSQEEESNLKRLKSNAGWTVICNDRVVAYCDRTELTGWGTGNVPAFHNQFNAIAGIVHFRSNDSLKLPVTTTKRGVDANSRLYLYIRGFMMEGTKKFTSYTNKWKNFVKTERQLSRAATPVSVTDVADEIPSSEWKQVKGSTHERKFDPNLPVPEKAKESVKMIFYKPIKDVRRVSMYLFDRPDENASDVAEKCFDKVFKETK